MSREPQWHLTLTLHGPTGERYAMSVPMDHMAGEELARIKPPSRALMEFGLVSKESVIEVIRKRTYRKDFFKHECLRLGTLLSERMEDAEGWHDESRVEPAKQQLRGR